MNPRPSRENPKCFVIYGRSPFNGESGVVQPGRYFRENPPDPLRGITLVKRRGAGEYFKRLKSSDQLSQMEAAAVLRVSRMQVNRWVRDGEIPDRKVFGTSRIRLRDLIRFARRKRLPYFKPRP